MYFLSLLQEYSIELAMSYNEIIFNEVLVFEMFSFQNINVVVKACQSYFEYIHFLPQWPFSFFSFNFLCVGTTRLGSQLGANLHRRTKHTLTQTGTHRHTSF